MCTRRAAQVVAGDGGGDTGRQAGQGLHRRHLRHDPQGTEQSQYLGRGLNVEPLADISPHQTSTSYPPCDHMHLLLNLLLQEKQETH